jgi:serine/threonine protein phosphatase PrpC
MLVECFVKTDYELRKKQFDVNFSGTTVVTVALIGNKLICANCGDSRAMVGMIKPKSYSGV